jgi:spore coat-associated protein N
MQRAAVLWRASPGRLVAALFALMLAAAMAVGSGANFNSTSANPGNIVTAGNLSHSNSKPGAAILTVDKMKPGDSQNGTAEIANDGDIAGNFSVASSVTDNAGGKGGKLSTMLDLKVEDITNAGNPVSTYNGKLAGFASTALGKWTAGEKHTYRFTVSWPGNNSSDVDNTFMGSKVTADFKWESTS